MVLLDRDAACELLVFRRKAAQPSLSLDDVACGVLDGYWVRIRNDAIA